jgi:uncharacterized protein
MTEPSNVQTHELTVDQAGSSRKRRPRAAARLALRAVLAILVLYACAVVYLVTQETRLIFQAGRPMSAARPAIPYEQIDLPRADGARQFAWILRDPAASTWILFLHGNSATIASRVNIARYEALRGLGVNVAAPEYRGFAGLPGLPSEGSLGVDARAAFDYLTDTLRVPPARIVIYGWSLGSAVAVSVAAQVPEAALVLEGAPASVMAIGQQRYPMFPIRFIVRNPFESIRRIQQVGAPVLFLHSPEDEVIPIAEGRRLFEAALQPKRFVEVRGGHVYAGERDTATFFGAIRTFLSEHGLLDAMPASGSNHVGQPAPAHDGPSPVAEPAAASPRR